MSAFCESCDRGLVESMDNLEVGLCLSCEMAELEEETEVVGTRSGDAQFQKVETCPEGCGREAHYTGGPCTFCWHAHHDVEVQELCDLADAAGEG